MDYGSQWPLEIQKQLVAYSAFILIMTPRSLALDWVQSELQRAKRKLKPIFPLLLEGNELWLSVEPTQYYDVRGRKFPDGRFYSAIKRVISPGHRFDFCQDHKKQAILLHFQAKLPKITARCRKPKPHPLKSEVRFFCLRLSGVAKRITMNRMQRF